MAQATHNPVDMRAYTAKVLRIFAIIALLTLAQILWAVFLSDGFSTSVNGFVYFALVCMKIYYMLLEFMHLKYEKKIFNITVFSAPGIMMIWFIISFFYEGHSGLSSQRKYNYRRPEPPAQQVSPKPAPVQEKVPAQ